MNTKIEPIIQTVPEPQRISQAKWVIMGVCGCGKTEVGSRLANELAIPFIEGDTFHSRANIDKMSAGIPLTDEDRHAWLLTLQAELSAIPSGVLSCSALKRRYRDILRRNNPSLVFVYLHGDEQLLTERLDSRVGHFMPAALLQSQLTVVEPLQEDEQGFTLDIRNRPEDLVQSILHNITFCNQTIQL